MPTVPNGIIVTDPALTGPQFNTLSLQGIRFGDMVLTGPQFGNLAQGE